MDVPAAVLVTTPRPASMMHEADDPAGAPFLGSQILTSWMLAYYSIMVQCHYGTHTIVIENLKKEH